MISVASRYITVHYLLLVIYRDGFY